MAKKQKIPVDKPKVLAQARKNITNPKKMPSKNLHHLLAKKISKISRGKNKKYITAFKEMTPSTEEAKPNKHPNAQGTSSMSFQNV